MAAHLVSTSMRLQVVTGCSSSIWPLHSLSQGHPDAQVDIYPRMCASGLSGWKAVASVAMIRWSQWCGRWHCWHQYEEGCGAQPATWLWSYLDGPNRRWIKTLGPLVLNIVGRCENMRNWILIHTHADSLLCEGSSFCLFVYTAAFTTSVRSKWRNCRRNLGRDKEKAND